MSKRLAKHFYLAILKQPLDAKLVYTTEPDKQPFYEYYSFFYDYYRVIIIDGNKYKTEFLPIGGSIFHIFQSDRKFIYLLNFDFISFTTHNGNLALFQIGLESQSNLIVRSSLQNTIITTMPSITKFWYLRGNRLTITHGITETIGNSQTNINNSFIKYYNFDENRYEIIPVSSIEYDE